jgi:hypothetical protein
MELKNLVKNAKSKKTMMQIAERAIESPSELLELVNYSNSKDDAYFYSASWALSLVSDSNKDLLMPHIASLLQTIQSCQHLGLKRNLMKVLQNIDIPKNLVFEIGDTCLGFLKNNKATIAVKAYAVTTLEHLLIIETCFHEETLFELEKQMIHATPAFKARAVKYLKKAKRMRI